MVPILLWPKESKLKVIKRGAGEIKMRVLLSNLRQFCTPPTSANFVARKGIGSRNVKNYIMVAMGPTASYNKTTEILTNNVVISQGGRLANKAKTNTNATIGMKYLTKGSIAKLLI
jgi:hypothetical protein